MSCPGLVFDPDRQEWFPRAGWSQHVLNPETKRCVYCGGDIDPTAEVAAEPAVRRVEEDGVIVEGPEA